MKYFFKHLLGEFAVDEKCQQLKLILDKKEIKKLMPLPAAFLPAVLQLLKDKKHFRDFYEKNLRQTKQGIKESVGNDQLIMQVISSINELDLVCNSLSKRLREWYGLYFPELSETVASHEHFVTLVITKTRESFLRELGIQETMGADLKKEHVEEMQKLARHIQQLYLLRQEQDKYLEKIMQVHCPNLLELAGATIGAKLLELGKGLKHLAVLPASTIQLLGAEKALFRHIKTGAKAPKYGVIYQHQLVQNAPREQKGKAARMLADKLSLCARLDYFKGDFKAKEYRQELEVKFTLK